MPNALTTDTPGRRLPPRTRSRWAVLAVVWLLASASACRVQAPVPAPEPFDGAAAPAGVTEAYGRLLTPPAPKRGAAPNAGVRVQSDKEHRRVAAETLLATDHPAAWSALSDALGPDAPAPVRRAVLRAVATGTQAPAPALWRPLAALLENPLPADLAPDLGPALGRFDRDDLRAHLIDLAQDPQRPPTVRRQVIDAMAYQRDRGVAAALLSLTARTELPRVQAAAFSALATLTARDDLGRDRRAWDAWWARVSRLSQSQWQRELIDSLARRRAARRQSDGRLAERLNAVERAYYTTAAKPDRPAVLTAMLDSPLRSSRLLALELTQTLLVEDADLDEPLRAALRGRLSDQDADVRARSALVLRDVSDEPGADLAAARLIDGTELDDAVRSAYLRLLARLPRKEATPGILALLDDPILRADAAGALSATSRAALLAPRQATEAQTRLRRLLTPEPTVGPDGAAVPAPAPLAPGPDSPQLVTLLGQVGDSADWQNIERWLDDPDPVIKQASAQAWADLGRSLPALADRVDDPVILPIVLQAAERDGQDADTLLQLAATPPPVPRLVPAWERALVAMAGRVAPAAVHPVLDRLDADRPDPDPAPDAYRVLRERSLTSALERTPEEAESRRAYLGLRLLRADARRVAGQADLAISDYEKLLPEAGAVPSEVAAAAAAADPPVDPDPDAVAAEAAADAAHAEAVYRGLIPACLDAGRHADALQAAEAFLLDGKRPIARDPLLLTLVDAGLRAIDLGRPGVGVDLHAGVGTLLDAAPPDAPRPEGLTDRLARLEAALAPPKRTP